MEKPVKHTTEALAEFVLDLRAEDVPAATVETVLRCVLDLVGAAAAGAQSEAALIARAAAARLGGAGAADTWFGGGRRQAVFAAFANSAAASALDAAKILAGLGENFAVDGVYFKPYACCRWIHCALDGLCDLMERHSLRAADISAIEVYTFARALRLNNHPDPDNLESAQYSLPFCMAAVALEGKDGLLPMRTRLLHRPDLVALAGRISLHVDAGLDRMFPECTSARVVIRTDSQTLESVCQHPLGDPANPMDWGMLVHKFQHVTNGLLSPAHEKEMIRAVQSLPVNGLTLLQGWLSTPLG